MWADALNAKSVPEVMKFISSQTGLQMGSGEEHEKKKSLSLSLNPEEPEKSPKLETPAKAEPGKSENPEESEVDKPQK